MSSVPTSIGPLLQGFFVEHLLQHKHVSPQTIASYRDTFRLLLQYAHKQLKAEPAVLKVAVDEVGDAAEEQAERHAGRH